MKIPQPSPVVASPSPNAQRVVPLLGSASLSFILHGLLLLFFSLATWSAFRSAPDDNKDYQVQATVDDQPLGFSGGFRFAGHAMIDRPDSAKESPGESKTDLSNLLTKDDVAPPAPAPSQDKQLGAALDGTLSRTDIVGVGLGGGSAAGHSGNNGGGSGLGDSDFAGGGPVGTLWGVGQGQSARSVVYVMDRSGSMIDTFSLLQRELMRAIGSLNRDQLFNVLWFNEGRATELFPRLKAATLENKRDAFDAIKLIVPNGQTQPIDAVRRALSYKPDVLFLLSDGDFGEDNKKIVQTIRQMNQGKRIKINTILFVYDTMGEGERVLREIAEANHGVYKHVTEEDIKQ